MRGQRHALAIPYPRERPGTHCTGGWVGLRTGLDRCGKSRPPSGFDLRTVQPVGSRYTDYSIRPLYIYIIHITFRIFIIVMIYQFHALFVLPIEYLSLNQNLLCIYLGWKHTSLAANPFAPYTQKIPVLFISVSIRFTLLCYSKYKRSTTVNTIL